MKKRLRKKLNRPRPREEIRASLASRETILASGTATLAKSGVCPSREERVAWLQARVLENSSKNQ